MWYVLIWVAPAQPSEDAYFIHAGPFAMREAAVAAAREATNVGDDDRYVRVIASGEPPTGAQWDDAEEIEPASADELRLPCSRARA
jgi:hypothetical protein